MEIKITVNCCLCTENHVNKIDLPDGWGQRSDEIYEEHGFCPKHSSIADFADSQCAGCVGGWGDCDLWKGFAYEHNRDLSNDELSIIRKGICPHRTNGTFRFDSNVGEIENIDLSNAAPTKSGEALADAILEYWETYFKKDTPTS